MGHLHLAARQTQGSRPRPGHGPSATGAASPGPAQDCLAPSHSPAPPPPPTASPGHPPRVDDADYVGAVRHGHIVCVWAPGQIQVGAWRGHGGRVAALSTVPKPARRRGRGGAAVGRRWGGGGAGHARCSPGHACRWHVRPQPRTHAPHGLLAASNGGELVRVGGVPRQVGHAVAVPPQLALLLDLQAGGGGGGRDGVRAATQGPGGRSTRGSGCMRGPSGVRCRRVAPGHARHSRRSGRPHG